MRTNSIKDFTKFEVGKTTLDKIVGAATVDEKVHSGDGVGIGGKTCREWLVIYDDNSWSHEYVYTE